MDRRRRHRRRPYLAVRGQHLLDRTKCSASKLARYRVRAVKIRIDHTHKANGLSLLFQFVVDAGMIASEDAYAHHRDGNRTVSFQGKTLARPVASRKRNCK